MYIIMLLGMSLKYEIMTQFGESVFNAFITKFITRRSSDLHTHLKKQCSCSLNLNTKVRFV